MPTNAPPRHPPAGPPPVATAPAAAPAAAASRREAVAYTKLPFLEGYFEKGMPPYRVVDSAVRELTIREDQAVIAQILTGDPHSELPNDPDARLFYRFLDCLAQDPEQSAYNLYFRDVFSGPAGRFTNTTGLVPVLAGITAAHERFGTTDKRPPVIDFARFMLASCIADAPLKRAILPSKFWNLVDQFPRLKKIAADKRITDEEVHKALAELPIATSIELLVYLRGVLVSGREDTRNLRAFMKQVEELTVHRLFEMLMAGEHSQLPWRLDPIHMIVRAITEQAGGDRASCALRLSGELAADKAFLDAIKRERKRWFDRGSFAELIVAIGAGSEFLELILKDIPEAVGNFFRKPAPAAPAPAPSAQQASQPGGPQRGGPAGAP